MFFNTCVSNIWVITKDVFMMYTWSAIIQTIIDINGVLLYLILYAYNPIKKKFAGVKSERFE